MFVKEFDVLGYISRKDGQDFPRKRKEFLRTLTFTLTWEIAEEREGDKARE